MNGDRMVIVPLSTLVDLLDLSRTAAAHIRETTPTGGYADALADSLDGASDHVAKGLVVSPA